MDGNWMDKMEITGFDDEFSLNDNNKIKSKTTENHYCVKIFVFSPIIWTAEKKSKDDYNYVQNYFVFYFLLIGARYLVEIFFANGKKIELENIIYLYIPGYAQNLK